MKKNNFIKLIENYHKKREKQRAETLFELFEIKIKLGSITPVLIHILSALEFLGKLFMIIFSIGAIHAAISLLERFIK